MQKLNSDTSTLAKSASPLAVSRACSVTPTWFYLRCWVWVWSSAFKRSKHHHSWSSKPVHSEKWTPCLVMRNITWEHLGIHSLISLLSVSFTFNGNLRILGGMAYHGALRRVSWHPIFPVKRCPTIAATPGKSWWFWGENASSKMDVWAHGGTSRGTRTLQLFGSWPFDTAVLKPALGVGRKSCGSKITRFRPSLWAKRKLQIFCETDRLFFKQKLARVIQTENR